MGPILKSLSRNISRGELLDQLADTQADVRVKSAQDEIYSLLRNQAGHDFSGYKTKTFLRRVQRRMNVVQAETIEDYVGRLRRDPPEVTNLFRDLLINVTSFFRDADAFDALGAQVIPKLFEGVGAHDTLRIWVPGCATGEEVYSIGMLMRECADSLPAVPRMQLFATDIDENALSVARAGRYPETMLDGLSQKRRKRFFTHDGSSYIVGKDVREMCIFSPHSVIRDPPFSRMDMISCRNLLIYFGPDVQRQVIPIFHYALKPGGFLFLGASEGISQHSELFSTIDKKHRLFQSREHPEQRYRFPLAVTAPVQSSSRVRPGQSPVSSSFPLHQIVEAHVLDRFAPAHVVVNGEGDVVYYSARTGRFLEPPAGPPNRQLLAMLRRGLRLDVKAALRQAMDTGLPAMREDVMLNDDEDRVQSVSVTVEPLSDRGLPQPLYLILFASIGPPMPRSESIEHQRRETEGAVADLEQELRDTRERLQSTIEEYETALEELKSSNEELVSVNEEAQSTNEELEASKEEMQSLNEELNTINAELNSKVEELDRANNDLRNLFQSTQIATIFLDRNLVIRNFTPAASSFFKLRAADVGRPLTELAGYLEYPDLKEHIRKVVDDGETIEHQITRDDEETSYLVRLIPYRDDHSRIEGAIVAFVDVTNLVQAEKNQRVLVAELNHRARNMLTVMTTLVRQSGQSSDNVGELVETLVGRLQAMGRVFDGFVQDNWKLVDVSPVIRGELKAFGEQRFNVESGAVELPTTVALSLSLIVHELATNAVKYGALSKSEGRVEISWSVEGDLFHLVWAERDGPAVSSPSREGFGTKLIRGEVKRYPRGKLEVTFAPEGVIVSLQLPVAG